MQENKVIVIGGSAGGIEALKELVAALPSQLNAAVFVVIHFPPSSVSYLADILTRRGALPAHLAQDGETIEPGRIYVSVPDYHLVVEPNRVRLTRAARENHSRPSIDVLLRTAAQAYGTNVIGVVLSGLLNDGTAGLIDVKKHGGIAIVQNPDTASFTEMPLSALRNVPQVNYVLSPQEIAQTLIELTHTQPKDPLFVEEKTQDPRLHETPQRKEERVAKMPPNDAGSDTKTADEIVDIDTQAQQSDERDGLPSIYSCPDCGGVLWQLNDNNFIRFRCHVGHAFSGESLLQQQAEALENAMWYALRVTIDKSKLSRHLAVSARERGHETSAAHFEAQAEAAESHARVLRQVVEQNSNGQGSAANGLTSN